MTVAQTRNTFSRKTIAIAVASAVTMGGIAIPQAGAVAGVEGASYVRSTPKMSPDGENLLRDENGYLVPDMEAEYTSDYGEMGVSGVIPAATWGGFYGGIYDNVNVAGGNKVSGFGFGVGGTFAPGIAVGTENHFGDLKDLSSLTYGDYLAQEGVGDAEVPMSVKKVLAVAFAIANDVNKKGRLSPEVEAKFAEFGYTGDFDRSKLQQNFKTSDENARNGATRDDGGFSELPIGEKTRVYVGETATTREEMERLNINGGMLATTPADALLSSVGALSYRSLALVGELQNAGGKKPADISFEDIYNQSANFEDPGSDSRRETLDRTAYKAIVDMAAALPDSAVEEPGRYMIRGVHGADFSTQPEGLPEGEYIFPLLDLDNSNVPAIEDLHKTEQNKDTYVDNVEKLPNGDYKITRNDGTSWTIELKDIRDKLAELDKKETVSPDELKKVQDDLDKVKKDVEDLQGKDDALQKEIDRLKKDVEGLDKRVTKLEKDVKDLKNSTIKEVVKNGDGTYTLIRVDGTKVPGNIDPRSGSVTDVKTDGQGNLVITIDGKDKTVPLDQVKVTEENKGTPKHTVTITTPDGKSVTFNVFDTYVTDIKWNEAEGVYEIYRSDVDGGKTVWKTIDLSDLRNRIDALEKKDSPSRDEYNTLVTEVRENRELIEKLKEQIKDQNATDQEKITSILEKITEIEKQLTDMQADLDDIKARLTKVEGRTDDITKCVAGAGMAGIPALLSIPLMVMTQLNIPGIKDLNTQIQKQIGIYNPELARAWERNGGVLQAGAVLAGLAGMIGGIAYLAKQCDPMMQSDAAKETDLGQLSSKLDKGSSKKDAGATQPDKQDAPAADAPADADAEAPAEGAVEGAAEAAEPATEPSEDLVAAK